MTDSPVLIWTLVAVVVIPLLIGGLIAFALWNAVNTLAGPDFRVRRVNEEKARHKFEAAAEFHPWVKKQGFRWIGGYEIRQPEMMFIAAWKHQASARYFCIYTNAGQNYFDFVTVYEEEQALTTSGSKDAFTLPFPPGKYTQAFPDAEVDEMWEEHRSAEKRLKQDYGLRVSTTEVEFAKLITKAAREQARYVKSIFLWPIRGVFWYLTRGSKTNRPIE